MLSAEEKHFYDYLEDKSYLVHLFYQDGKKCAEVESWTEHDIDMIIELMPFTIQELEGYYEGFNMFEEVTLQGQDERFRDAFSLEDAVKEYSEWLKRLSKTINDYSPIKND